MAYYNIYYGLSIPQLGGGYPSNYPVAGGYGGGYNPYAAAASGYPPSSGPPPPPGGYGGAPGGYYQQQQQPSYGDARTSQPSSPAQAAKPGSGQRLCSRTFGGAYAGAVPGFTVPPQGLPMPPSRSYAQANHAFQPVGCQIQNIHSLVRQNNQDDPKYAEYQQWKEEQEEKEERKRRKRARRNKQEDEEQEEEDAEEIDKLKRMLEYEKVKTQEALEQMRGNEFKKEEMKQAFVDELMRRQTVSGTFEDATGTVMQFRKYDETDPVCKYFVKEKGHTIATEDWDPLYDSEFLYKAMDGMGTNEDAIIYVTGSRSNAQRQKIRLEFKTAYGKDIIKELKSELSGDFKTSILACFETAARYDAYEVKNAIYGLGTDERTLIEIMLTRTNAQIQEMRSDYNQITYGKQKDPESSMEQDIEGDTSGDFKRLLISSSTGNRRQVDRPKLTQAIEEVDHDGKFTGMFKINYDKLADPKKCERMAQELFEAGEDQWGTDEATFNRIFSTQDFYTLRSVYDKYVKITQRDILNSVDRETSGNFRKGLCAVAQSVKCRPKFFAEALHRSMKGLGTDDSTLIRICVSRSEIDMVQIKACFLNEYNQTLWNFINEDCSGDYRKLLQAVVGKN